MRVLRVARVRKIEYLKPVIGDETARLAVNGDLMQAFTRLLVVIGFVPFGLWAALSGPAAAWIPPVIGLLLTLVAFVTGALLARRSALVASEYVSKRVGRAVRLTAHGWHRSRWEREIDRERASGER